MFCSKEELMNLKNTKPDARVWNYDHADRYDRYVRATSIDETKASEILESALRATLNNNQSKVNRPWELIDLTSNLDPEQAWLGFEFETGFSTRSVYEQVINHVWFNYNHVAIDREGCGYACEITYSPENVSTYENGEAGIQKLLAWLGANKIKQQEFGADMVGTHVNISTPTYRHRFKVEGTAFYNRGLARLINDSIHCLGVKQIKKLFGRVPYGRCGDMGGWLEFKIFRSTDDLARFNEYVAVSKQMAGIVEQLSQMPALPARLVYNEDNPSLGVKGTSYISNFFEILNGDERPENLRIDLAPFDITRYSYSRGFDGSMLGHLLGKE